MINRKMDVHQASKPGPAEAEDKGDQQELSWKAAHAARVQAFGRPVPGTSWKRSVKVFRIKYTVCTDVKLNNKVFFQR